MEWFERRLIPVLVIEDVAAVPALGDTLVAAGLPVAEVTFRTPAAADVVAAFAARGDVAVGAGTVLTSETAAVAVAAGATFVVSPGLDEDVVEFARGRGGDVVPGVATASEIMRARRLGVRRMKLFPADVAGGVAALKAYAAVFPDVAFVPTGGISEANLAEYLALPNVAAVGGSWLAPRDLIAKAAWDEIGRRCRAAVAAVQELGRG